MAVDFETPVDLPPSAYTFTYEFQKDTNPSFAEFLNRGSTAEGYGTKITEDHVPKNTWNDALTFNLCLSSNFLF